MTPKYTVGMKLRSKFYKTIYIKIVKINYNPQHDHYYYNACRYVDEVTNGNIITLNEPLIDTNYVIDFNFMKLQKLRKIGV